MNTLALPKRLIEVDLPIRAISEQARREKSIRHGHISTLHLWWARRPLAACRAVICAALWPDPADPLCPESFRITARKLMGTWARDNLGMLGPGSYSTFNGFRRHPEKLDDNTELRKALYAFVAEFSNWDHSVDSTYLDTTRQLTSAAHEALGGLPGTRPLVADPFAGGGAIPLEALRVGADAFASDLNPVSVLLNKVQLEYVPRYGQQLVEEITRWGNWVRDQAVRELADYYPPVDATETPIAYLWARTIACEGPGCGAVVPMLRSLWLVKKARRSTAMRLIPDRVKKRVLVELVHGAKAKDVSDGTVRRGSVTCPCCGYTTPVTSTRRQLLERQGGGSDAQLLCVVTSHANEQGRFYRLPDKREAEAVNAATSQLELLKASFRGSPSLVPDEPLPLMSGVFNAPIYGHNTWGSLATPRQLLTLVTLARLTREAGLRIASSQDEGLARAVRTCLALVIDRQANTLSSLARWNVIGEKVEGVFSRQALPMVWDFAEANPLSDSTGCFSGALNWVIQVCEQESRAAHRGAAQAEVASATSHPLPNDAVDCLFTDPPYYNAVPYADLSDFFYVWLKRTVADIYPEMFATPLAPKDDECCEMAGWDPERYGHKNNKWYEAQMGKAMVEARRILDPRGIGVVVFAHKSTAGWEAQLQAMVSAGWTVTGSWPIDTEMGSRLRAQNSAVLASSIHLVCRPRVDKPAIVGDWRDILQELPERIHAWMPRLATEGVVGADAIFSCLGPALEVFSRYARVEKASGEAVTLREYLEYVWAAVAKEALDMIFTGADASGFEADSRLTAMWLWTLSSGAGVGVSLTEELGVLDEEDDGGKGKPTAGFSLEYDAARKIAQGLGVHLEKLSSVVEVKGDTARLLSVSERATGLLVLENTEKPSTARKKITQLTFDTSDQAAEDVSPYANVITTSVGQTLLDRLHQSMLLFASGRSEALRRFIVEDGVGRDQRFWGLAQALSALYPAESDEKRWVDGVLARKRSMGF